MIITFPVPGGPNNKTPFHGSKIPVKKWGYLRGNITASFNNRFASSRPTMSVNLTLGFSTRISLYKYAPNSLSSFKSPKSGRPFRTLTSKKSSGSSSIFLGYP